MTLDEAFRLELADLVDRDRLRETRTLGGPDRVHPSDIYGRALLSFCSNDYLALSGHPALAAAATITAAQAGFGAGSSRLVSGESPAHRALEADLATLLARPSALLFATGYQTNIGVLTALAGPADLIVSDAANHASIIDGCRLSRARTVVYPHRDVHGAAGALATPGKFRRRLLVTESLFSMDGDRAPLTALAALAVESQAALVVDEAHALGVIGPAGAGLCAEMRILPDVLVGTLGKSFGAQGGFAAGSKMLREILVNRARQFIYSTASPPALAAAAGAALALSSGAEGQRRRDRAHSLAGRLRSGLNQVGIRPLGEDLIIPIVIGDDREALAVASQLFDRGILVPAIRPPTVPEGTARLRMTLSAGHTADEVDRLIAALADAVPTRLRAKTIRKH